MGKLKFVLQFSTLIFSFLSCSICHSQNIANILMSEFLNTHFEYSAIAYSGSSFGYNLKNYDSVFIIKSMNDEETISKWMPYEMDNELFSKVNFIRNDKPKLIFCNVISSRKPTIVISNLKRLKNGYIFTARVIINEYSYYNTELYYSNRKKEIIKIEDTEYILE